MTVKLKDGESQHLADLILRVARPRSEEEAAELQVWIKRLRGGDKLAAPTCATAPTAGSRCPTALRSACSSAPLRTRTTTSRWTASATTAAGSACRLRRPPTLSTTRH